MPTALFILMLQKSHFHEICQFEAREKKNKKTNQSLNALDHYTDSQCCTYFVLENFGGEINDVQMRGSGLPDPQSWQALAIFGSENW